MPALRRALAAEFLGTLLLLTAVIGSGIMGERLAGGNAAIALLANTLATVFALFVLIEVLGPVSGAHFNPIVTLALGRAAGLAPAHRVLYVAVQLAGAAAGAAAGTAPPRAHRSPAPRSEPAHPTTSRLAACAATVPGVAAFAPTTSGTGRRARSQRAAQAVRRS